jgi:hypothetical protein
VLALHYACTQYALLCRSVPMTSACVSVRVLLETAFRRNALPGQAVATARRNLFQVSHRPTFRQFFSSAHTYEIIDHASVPNKCQDFSLATHHASVCSMANTDGIQGAVLLYAIRARSKADARYYKKCSLRKAYTAACICKSSRLSCMSTSPRMSSLKLIILHAYVNRAV